MQIKFKRQDIYKHEQTGLTRKQAYLGRLAEIEALWKIRKENKRPSQSLVPKDPNLIQKLGIKKGEKILYFMGCYGDWAKAIATQTHLTYTDATKSMIDFAKRENLGNIKRFKQITAELVPQRPMIYDWSVSYEPIPILLVKTLKLNLTRSLLNNKGGKIIFSKLFNDSAENAMNKHAKLVASIYGAEVIKETKKVISNLKNSSTNAEISLITIKTNPQARKKAFLDLRILNATDRENLFTIEELAKKFKVSQTEILQSIMRLEKLTGQKQKNTKLALMKMIRWLKENW